jgi:hypothetical protein
MPRTDVSLYGLVHGILEAERARDTAERRAGRRHTYVCTQFIAAVHEGISSDELRFHPVQCVDLSAAGLLYIANEPPPGNELVIALGSDRLICLRAEVIRDTLIVQEGRSIHQVACRFTGREAGA